MDHDHSAAVCKFFEEAVRHARVAMGFVCGIVEAPTVQAIAIEDLSDEEFEAIDRAAEEMPDDTE